MTKRNYFGTDGVRGQVGTSLLTADFALRLANAAARILAPQGGTVLIGKDTRLSGYMFESALEAGLVSAGVDAALIGPLPTPGIAYMTKHLNCAFGIVISASHNGYEDNGIKFFTKDGEKLSDAEEEAIEKLLAEPPVTVDSAHLGRATRVDESRSEYEHFCAKSANGLSLSGMRLVVDCANGAAYKVAPRVFSSLGAEVTPVGTSPNGKNINDGCGATSTGLLQMMVKGTKAHAGIALDGDGDRLIMVDEDGAAVNGDVLVTILAMARKSAGTLKEPVVGTIMTNGGAEAALKKAGIAFERAQVGDRYVLELLKKTGGTLGGESSGHIIMLDKTTTGDGIIAAIEVLAVMEKTGKSLKELASAVQMFPQVLLNVKTEKKIDVNASAIAAAVKGAEAALQGGRISVRASGTEPLIRIMVEAGDEASARGIAEKLADVVRAQ